MHAFEKRKRVGRGGGKDKRNKGANSLLKLKVAH